MTTESIPWIVISLPGSGPIGAAAAIQKKGDLIYASRVAFDIMSLPENFKIVPNETAVDIVHGRSAPPGEEPMVLTFSDLLVCEVPTSCVYESGYQIYDWMKFKIV